MGVVPGHTMCKVHEIKETMLENVTCKVLDQQRADGTGAVNKEKNHDKAR